MKKLLLVCITFISIIAHSFAGPADFFNHRIFEIKLNAPVNVTNNTMAIADFLQKEVIIDLKELYYGMPKKGLDFTLDTMPNAAITLDFKKGLHFGVEAGVDMFSTIDISKDLFRFIALGNDPNESIKVPVDGYADAFAFVNLDFGLNLKEKLSIRVQPSLFASALHVATADTYAEARCNEDNSYNLILNAKMNVYSSIPVNQDIMNHTDVLLNQWLNNLGPSLGFDMGGEVSYKLTDFLTVSGYVRIPLAPSHLNYQTVISYTQDYAFSLDNLMGKKNSENGEGDSGETSNEGTSSGQTESTADTSGLLFADPIDSTYYIHRPMKFSVSANFTPFSWLMSYYGTLGIGIKHPFSKTKGEMYPYIDYLIGTKLSLWNMISLYLSTERTDEIYKHKATLALNFRIVEVDAGIAFESANLQTSFKGSGLGAFVTACIGF